jgi:DNA-binding LacI/PurR family transcriptional regulator
MSSSLRDVAEAAGVSLSTASRVFSNAANVSEEIRNRVLVASAELGYRYRERGRKPQTITLRRILLFVRTHNRFNLSAMLGDFYGYVLQGVEAECRRQRLTLAFAHDDRDTTLEEQFDHLELDEETGVLLVGPFAAEDVAAVHERGIPLVLLNNLVEQPVDAVLPDYYGGAQLAVRYLLAQGHRQIAYLHGRDRYTTRQRLNGYRDTLAEAAIAYDPRLVVQSSMSPQAANEAVSGLLRTGVPFSALFCVNDFSAYGAILALQEAGLRPGEDVSLVGFDDVDLSGLTRVALTTIHVPKLEMGAVAVRRLQERANDALGTPQRIVLNVSLVERDSVRKIAL